MAIEMVTKKKGKKKAGPVKKAPSARPDTYHHGDLRTALIDAGLEILRADGAHSLSLREAARRVGVSHMAPYRHFPDKESLMAAIAQEGFLRLGRRVAEAVAKHGHDSKAQLEAAAVAYTLFALEDTEHLRVMFGGFIPNREKFPKMREAATANFRALCSILEGCRASGAIGAGDTQRQALTAWASVHGIAMLLLENQLQFLEIDRQKAEEVTRGIARTIILGLSSV